MQYFFFIIIHIKYLKTHTKEETYKFDSSTYLHRNIFTTIFNFKLL